MKDKLKNEEKKLTTIWEIEDDYSYLKDDLGNYVFENSSEDNDSDRYSHL